MQYIKEWTRLLFGDLLNAALLLLLLLLFTQAYVPQELNTIQCKINNA